MNAYDKLISGYKEFFSEYISAKNDEYRSWASNKQAPKVMVIGCSDSRVNPAILTHSGLGAIFSVNNVANIVPAYQGGEHTHHSTSSAIEFAVNHLEVEHIIIMGHSKCGGIKALMDDDALGDTPDTFIKPWMEIVSSAKDKVNKHMADSPIEDKLRACEKQAILVSLANIATFPWVIEAVKNGKLKLHAWYFRVDSGLLQEYDFETGDFVQLVESEDSQ